MVAGAEQFPVGLLTTALILNYLLGAPLIGPRVGLAPLYDIASGFPYDAHELHGLRRAAMKIGGESRFGEIERRRWERFATEIRYPATRLIDRVDELSRQLPDALSSALDGEPEAAGELRSRLLDPVTENCLATIGGLRH